jgi:hypothetical protein
MKKTALAILAAGVWINLCEFLRNELLFKQQWLDKYSSLGLSFPSAPVNGVMWVAWGFTLAGCIAALGRKHTFLETFAFCWVTGFLLMWIVIGNLNVLPYRLLPVAVPWSIVEVGAAVVISRKITGGTAL